ncbi:sel1 repeat family protein, partial [Puniceicoccaceae bacterium]|nr:sel1 repeat family protein [Puniceicoccaceae bacterium]
NGRGVPQDDVEAAKWYRKAAEQGHVEAQYNLGYMYDFGYGGVPEDDTEAVKWYRKAAEQGYAQAQYNLGMAYYYGHGVPEDYVESYMWLNLAAAQGDENAKHNKGILSKQMTKEQIAEAQKLSREWLAKRSE